ncbi:MAG: NAD(P)/FAD-dependent oxidoreductase, partial [Acutalibacteraceae bacterium]
LAVHLPNGRGVYTFCMCPGGMVVAAASEENRLVTNGMSHFARDGQNANSAVLVGVTPSDFGSDDVLAGIEFQRRLEAAAFKSGGGNYHAPVSRVDDFINRRRSVSYGSVLPTYRPSCTLTNLDDCLPQEIADSMRMGIQRMGGLLHGFDDGDAILTAVESRSSSPVRIVRNENFCSVNILGLYPCGEGAGYAGGIISAATDGIRVSEGVALQTSH